MMKFLIAACLVSVVYGQIPIPSREVGYVYKNGSDSAPVHLDVFIDLICPDSKQALPTLLQVAEMYGPTQLQLTAHIFPLPYHRNSFYATKGAHAVAALTKDNMTFDWFNLVYKNMPVLVNSATNQFSEDHMKDVFSSLAGSMGLVPATFEPMLDDPNIEEDARVAWKYGCTRGVAATPTFFVNDVMVGATPTWTAAQWKQLIDPILNPSQKRLLFKSHRLSACAPNTKRCEYLPGKIECCTSGEACIPNVGCRC
ncbi:hypothetical protein SNE40_006940 [Patella caerulea]|uniref:Thioredoxin-like fold domain-containing protein n=1 Tax=Patella caerulea TaxID=87958 RepID=A0AAN8JSW4_PATCE